MARVWRPLERPVALLVMGWSQERSATTLAIRFAFHALPLVLVVISSSASPVRGDDSRFRAVAPGVAHTTFKLQSDNGEPFSDPALPARTAAPGRWARRGTGVASGSSPGTAGGAGRRARGPASSAPRASDS